MIYKIFNFAKSFISKKLNLKMKNYANNMDNQIKDCSEYINKLHKKIHLIEKLESILRIIKKDMNQKKKATQDYKRGLEEILKG